MKLRPINEFIKLWVEPCPVCGEDTTEIVYTAEACILGIEADEEIMKLRDVIICDSPSGEGCFRSFHKDCFEKHKCSVYFDGKYR